jgi:ribosomal protein L12E/L44/L45/RPP1/RPP2
MRKALAIFTVLFAIAAVAPASTFAQDAAPAKKEGKKKMKKAKKMEEKKMEEKK